MTTERTNTALQVTDFNFYGDNLIALKDNATGEIYTAINSVLRGLGFKDEQVRYQRTKWINDVSISKGVLKFNIPSNGGNQNTDCINSRKLPLALAKINITKRMLRDYPDITEKLELYQDKCADVLASVFIDHKSTSEIDLQPFTDTLNALSNTLTALTSTITTMQQNIHTLKESQLNIQKQIPSKKEVFLLDFKNVSKISVAYGLFRHRKEWTAIQSALYRIPQYISGYKLKSNFR